MTHIHMLPTTLRSFVAAHWRWHTLKGDRIEHYQSQRAQRIVEYAHLHSPFYQAHWAGHDRREWRTLPVVDKTLMMSHFQSFNTRGVPYAAALQVAQVSESSHRVGSTLNGLTAGLSSGTSGYRGLFLLTDREIATWAGVILARALHELHWRGCRVAFFLRSFSNLYAGVDSPILQLHYFDLMQPLDEAVHALNDFMPHVLVGPPSLLDRLADVRQRGTLQIRPQRLIAVAEVLEPQDQTRLFAVFDAPIHQIYQSTEGLLAVSCSQGSLHIQEDLVAIQLERLTTPASELPLFTPVVTDLWRTTQPIIRYRLGDLVRVTDTPCPCGSPFRVITAVEDASTISVRPHSRKPFTFFPDMLRRIFCKAPTDNRLSGDPDSGQSPVHSFTDSR